MRTQKFEDLTAWQKGQDFAAAIYHHFGHIKDYNFKDQICRASVSVSNNIAEGFERRSQKEFRRFLNISQASCSEVRSMLYLASRFKYISKVIFFELLNQSNEVSKIITGLRKSLKI